MSIPVPVVDLAFGDYVLCSILLALLYGFSVLETAIRPINTRYELIARETAVTWAFFGILLTLIAGLAASALRGSPIELFLPAAPLVFVFRWALFYRESSKLIKSERIQASLDEQYSAQAFSVLHEAAGPLTLQELYEQMRRRLDYVRVAQAVDTPLTRALLPKALSELFSQWLLSESKVATLVSALEKKGDIAFEDGRYKLLPPPAGKGAI